jgi:lipoprotein NlpI
VYQSCYRLVVTVALLACTTTVSAQGDFSVLGLRTKALEALEKHDDRAAIENADAMIRQAPKDPRIARLAADIYLRAGEYKAAVRLFDRYLESEQQALPELWQRGIALYFRRDYQAAAKQFEVHRTVNPNDVENAAWHFLCVAKAQSPAAAKANVLPAPGDPRVPMEEVLQLLKTGDKQAITDKIATLEEDSQQRKTAQFYGDFYLGLYADAMGETAEAKKSMNRAAKDAPRNYMGDVARVYAKFLNSKR